MVNLHQMGTTFPCEVVAKTKFRHLMRTKAMTIVYTVFHFHSLFFLQLITVIFFSNSQFPALGASSVAHPAKKPSARAEKVVAKTKKEEVCFYL